MTTLTEILAGLGDKDRITASDVIAIRVAANPGLAISRDQAELLFRVNEAVASTAMEWRQLFVGMITDYVVRQQRPFGDVDEDQARWLVGRITRDGRITSPVHLDLLVHVLETAARAPRGLHQLALDEIAAAALVRQWREGAGPVVTQEDVRRVRAQLENICTAEAADEHLLPAFQVVFALNDVARGRPNAHTWRELFAETIGAALIAAEGETAAWLIARIGRDGDFDANEIALLQFVVRNCAKLSPALRTLADQALAEPASDWNYAPVFGRRRTV